MRSSLVSRGARELEAKPRAEVFQETDDERRKLRRSTALFELEVKFRFSSSGDGHCHSRCGHLRCRCCHLLLQFGYEACLLLWHQAFRTSKVTVSFLIRSFASNFASSLKTPNALCAISESPMLTILVSPAGIQPATWSTWPHPT